MSRLTETKPKFIENLDGMLHQLFRAAGITFRPDGDLERIRTIADRLGNGITHQAEVTSIEVAQKLQKAVLGAFEDMESAMDALERRIADLEAKK